MGEAEKAVRMWKTEHRTPRLTKSRFDKVICKENATMVYTELRCKRYLCNHNNTNLGSANFVT